MTRVSVRGWCEHTFVSRERRSYDWAEIRSYYELGHGASECQARFGISNGAWHSSRKPLAAEFTFNTRTLFVIGNHFNSKGGDQPLTGRFQPPKRSSETCK